MAAATRQLGIREVVFPNLIDKLRDVVGFYVDPLGYTIVLGVDEKSTQSLSSARCDPPEWFLLYHGS